MGCLVGILTFSQSRDRTSGFKSESLAPCRDPDGNVRIQKCALHSCIKLPTAEDSPSPLPIERRPWSLLQLLADSDYDAVSFLQGNSCVHPVSKIAITVILSYYLIPSFHLLLNSVQVIFTVYCTLIPPQPQNNAITSNQMDKTVMTALWQITPSVCSLSHHSPSVVQTRGGPRPARSPHFYPPRSQMMMISHQQLSFAAATQGYFIPTVQVKSL